MTTADGWETLEGVREAIEELYAVRGSLGFTAAQQASYQRLVVAEAHLLRRQTDTKSDSSTL
jgi:hypothetical protein